MTTRRWAPLVATVLVVALGAAACTASGGEAGAVTCPDGTTATPPTGPEALPSAELSVLGEERTVATACWVGQPLVVNFWAEWCGPCREEMPALEAVHQALGDQVRFIGVDYEDRTAAALRFADEVGVTYELVEDPDGHYFDAAGGRAAPYTILVDGEGTVVHRHYGPVTEASLTELLADHLDITP